MLKYALLLLTLSTAEQKPMMLIHAAIWLPFFARDLSSGFSSSAAAALGLGEVAHELWIPKSALSCLAVDSPGLKAYPSSNISSWYYFLILFPNSYLLLAAVCSFLSPLIPSKNSKLRFSLEYLSQETEGKDIYSLSLPSFSPYADFSRTSWNAEKV